MDYLFGRSRPAVAVVPSDRVVPLHFFEDSPLVQGNNMAVSLTFDAVLDPQKLRLALEGLVQQPGWERLGGRLRKNATGTIEWHIPAAFSHDRPAIAFAHVDHGVTAAAHAAARNIRLPQPSRVPAVVSNPDDFAHLAWTPGYQPGGIKDYLGTDGVDQPVLGLRVNSFTDTTVAVLQWQHVAFDALGMQYVVEGWQAMLWNKPDAVPTPVPYATDPFASLARGDDDGEDKEDHVLLDRRAGLAGMVKWGLGYGVDMLLRAKDNGMVCVPASFWQPQYEQALAELRAEAIAQGTDPAGVFLTENDVVTAWIMRCVVRLQTDARADRTVSASIAMSLRKAFEGDGGLLPPADQHHPYVGNAFGWSNVLVTAGDVRDRPLSWLAREVRRAINAQGTRAQHKAYFRLVRSAGTGLPVVVFGDGNMTQVGFSNWSKAGLFDLDFAPARQVPVAGSAPCRPSYVQENHGPIKPVDGFFILGKDAKGNYWASAYKLKGQWARLQEMLEKEFGEAQPEQK
ncbi:hypothetical protein F503_02425 [Ophiostoma piceae UAMH 11346]|uniref:Transferase family protein n=1 Tax=Ophiostoma piceae (strain UAMH 11346) TaxID=1262450 RepID=S3C0M5_OPHP1|nr:hypothetical protein F503_02425 [Ophiostoma piceae UAMH 11346]